MTPHSGQYPDQVRQCPRELDALSGHHLESNIELFVPHKLFRGPSLSSRIARVNPKCLEFDEFLFVSRSDQHDFLI